MLRRKWPRSSKVFLLLSIACGSGAFLLVQGYEARLEALRPAVGPSVTVVVSATDLSRGAVLSEADLSLQEMPSAFVPPGAEKTVADAIGRVLESDLAAGEVLTQTRVAGNDVGPLAALVPPDLRAVAIAAPVPEGLAAGDRIDVLATFGGGRSHVETVVSDVEVLRVPETGGGGALGDLGASDGHSTLVLLVSPEDAEGLAYAGAFATLSVSVVGSDLEKVIPGQSATDG